MKKRITVVEIDDIDVEIAIAEAIQLMPPNTCYEDKGTPVLAYLKKFGWRIVESQNQKDDRDKILHQLSTNKSEDVK